MLKTAAAFTGSLAATGLLWGWTAGQFTSYQSSTNQRFAAVQAHQNDALQSILCYLERRTLRSPTISDDQKVRSLRTLDRIDRVGHLRPCTNLPDLPR